MLTQITSQEPGYQYFKANPGKLIPSLISHISQALLQHEKNTEWKPGYDASPGYDAKTGYDTRTGYDTSRENEAIRLLCCFTYQ